MTAENTNTYEGLFLFPQAATADLQRAVDHIKSLLDRANAEIISLSKWDERRLAYEIKGNKRGVYFMVYFKAQGDKLASLERDCNLSEDLLRVMVTRADHMLAEQMEAADGQAQLADEIRMRGEENEKATSDSSVHVAKAVVATEEPKDAAPAEPAAPAADA